jgi:hypothetical protein
MDPKIKTTYDHILEALSLIALLVAYYPLIFFGKLDANALPIHFNINGVVDGWGSKYFIFFFPSIATIMYVGILYFEKNYKKLNYPIKIYKSEEMANSIYRLGVRLMRHMKLILITCIAFLSNTVISIAIGKSDGMNKFAIKIMLAVVISTLLFYYVKMLYVKKCKK